MATLEELRSLIKEEYEKVVVRAWIMFGPFTAPEVRIPKLDDMKSWGYFFPEAGREKRYGVLVSYEEKPVIYVNPWLFLRYLDDLGTDWTRKKLASLLSHEIVHHVKPDLPEIDVNVEEAKLFREIYP